MEQGKWAEGEGEGDKGAEWRDSAALGWAEWEGISGVEEERGT